MSSSHQCDDDFSFIFVFPFYNRIVRSPTLHLYCMKGGHFYHGKGKRNFKDCVQAFRDLVKARKNQEQEIVDEIKELQKEIQAISYDYSTERIK